MSFNTKSVWLLRKTVSMFHSTWIASERNRNFLTNIKRLQNCISFWRISRAMFRWTRKKKQEKRFFDTRKFSYSCTCVVLLARAFAIITSITTTLILIIETFITPVGKFSTRAGSTDVSNSFMKHLLDFSRIFHSRKLRRRIYLE